MAVNLERAEDAAREAFAALAERGLPGAVLALQHRDVRRTVALGVMDPATGAPMRAEAVFRIGSVSKLVVAEVMERLVQAGVLRWSDPPARWLPDLRLDPALTLEMLGAHRSGLRDALEDPAFRARINVDPARKTPLDVVVAASLAQPPRFEPGAAVAYANINALLLARVAEAASGASYADLAEELVLGPAEAPLRALGPLPCPDLRGFRHGLAPGRIEYGRVFYDATAFDPGWAGPAGDLAGTVDDVLRLGRHLGRRRLHVPPEARAAALTAPYRRRLVEMWGNWQGHAGDVPGFSAHLAWSPGGDVVVAVLANLSNLPEGAAPAEQIAAAALRFSAPG